MRSARARSRTCSLLRIVLLWVAVYPRKRAQGIVHHDLSHLHLRLGFSGERTDARLQASPQRPYYSQVHPKGSAALGRLNQRVPEDTGWIANC